MVGGPGLDGLPVTRSAIAHVTDSTLIQEINELVVETLMFTTSKKREESVRLLIALVNKMTKA